MLINSRYSNQYLVIPLTLNLKDSLPVVIILPSHSDLAFMSLYDGKGTCKVDSG